MAFARASSSSPCVLYRGFARKPPDRNFQPVEPAGSFSNDDRSFPRPLLRELLRELSRGLSKNESPLEREPLTLCGRFGWRSLSPRPPCAHSATDRACECTATSHHRGDRMSCLSVGVTDRSLAATGAAAARVADSGRPSRKIPIARAGQRVHRDDTVRLCHPARSTRHAAHAGQRKGERRSNHSAVRRQAGLGRRADIGISAAQCWLHCCRRDARAAGRPGPRPATSTSASSRAVARGASAPLRARAARGRRVRTSFASCSLLACAMGSCRHAYDDMGGGAMGIAPLRRSCCTQSAAAELEGVAAESGRCFASSFLTR